MRDASKQAGVTLVTGDTKVVDRGSGDGIFINTAGIGIVEEKANISPRNVRPGDVVIISGDIGRHGMAIMSAREGLELEGLIESDTAALCRPVLSMLEAESGIVTSKTLIGGRRVLDMLSGEQLPRIC